MQFYFWELLHICTCMRSSGLIVNVMYSLFYVICEKTKFASSLSGVIEAQHNSVYLKFNYKQATGITYI